MLCELFVCGHVYADLVILHTNDVHARIEEFTDGGGPCPPADAREEKCFGGLARRMSAIKEVREQYDNVILLDAGDQWQGTPWFYFYEGMEAAYFMNLLEYDVMVRMKMSSSLLKLPACNSITLALRSLTLR